MRMKDVAFAYAIFFAFCWRRTCTFLAGELGFTCVYKLVMRRFLYVAFWYKNIVKEDVS